MDGLVRTTVAEVEAAMGSSATYSAGPASDGMSVQVRWYPSGASIAARTRAAYALISRLNAAGLWVADTETYWNAQAADLLADGKPVWIGRIA
jgi:hypothetical protein